MVTRGKRPSLEQEVEELDAACRDPQSEAARDALRKALQRGGFLAAARAAKLIGRLRLAGLEGELEKAFDRFCRDGVKRDPGCRAQAAVIDALDQLECMSPAPFRAAARRVQNEPGYGGPSDTAVHVRARGLAGLARIGYQDMLLWAGELLADREAPVRQAALDALVHHGDRSGAGLAMLKLKMGDPEPMVLLASMNCLLSLAPDWGLEALRPILFGHDEDLRELAALALGQCGQESALTLLFELLDRTALEEDRILVMRALAFSRHERARQFLLERVAEARASEAEAAVAALGEHRYDPGLEARVREAAARNPEASLEKAIVRAFAPPDAR